MAVASKGDPFTDILTTAVSLIDMGRRTDNLPSTEAHATHSRNVNKITITLVTVANASGSVNTKLNITRHKASLLMGSGTTKRHKA